jgi:FecR protein
VLQVSDYGYCGVVAEVKRMRITRRPFGAPRALAFLALLACVAHGAVYADDTDPPGRVARLSDAEGSVSLQPQGVQDWTAAMLNRPLTTGDRLWSDQNSRAELDLGAAVIRLGNNTGFAFLNLDDRTAQMQLATGTIIVRVRDMQAGDNYEVDTPNVALSLQQPGEYRVEVNDRGDATVIKVSEGAALAAGGGGQTVAISAQELLTATGTGTLAYDSAPLGGPDDFDNWSSARDRQVEDSASGEYVASDVPGTQDLDDNGQWQQTPEYGYVWMPTTVADWVPYRYGQWVWISPWGWTWVDDAPWGYAPFHYGRWVQWNNGWAWVPGPRRARPVYGPALVAWVGGPAVGSSVSFGSNVGWFPLGPREAYVPNYRVSTAYVRHINTTNTTLVNTTYITNVYQNHLTPKHYANNRAAAVTTVSQDIFTSGQAVGAHAVTLPASVLAGALVTATAPAIAPIRQSVLGPAEGHGVVRPPAGLLHRAVVARTSPPHAPASFERQRAAIQANGGNPLGRAEIAQLQPVTADTRVRPAAPAGPVVAASALPHRAAAARAATGALQPPAATATLAERERALQTSRLPSAPHVSTPQTPPSGGLMYTQHPPPIQPHNYTADDPTHAYGRQSSMPVYHPPSATATYAPSQESAANSYQAAPRAAPPSAPRVTAPPPPRPQAPPPRQQSSPRDSAAHADRESRERIER